MAFTQQDLEELEDAIRALTTGGAVSVQLPDRTYRIENLKELRDTYEWMKTQVRDVADDSIMRIAFADNRTL